MILGKIEAVTGRSKSKDKQNRVRIWTLCPFCPSLLDIYLFYFIVTQLLFFLQQSVIPESDDAIAELDSVIDSYHKKSSKYSFPIPMIFGIIFLKLE